MCSIIDKRWMSLVLRRIQTVTVGSHCTVLPMKHALLVCLMICIRTCSVSSFLLRHDSLTRFSLRNLGGDTVTLCKMLFNHPGSPIPGLSGDCTPQELLHDELRIHGPITGKLRGFVLGEHLTSLVHRDGIGEGALLIVRVIPVEVGKSGGGLLPRNNTMFATVLMFNVYSIANRIILTEKLLLSV
jgi:hypothetical protein